MAGILGSYTDSTCNAHNALRNVTGYACGVTFTFKDSGSPPSFDSYGVVSLQECCAQVGRPLLRIPGNTGCEMQFCDIPATTSLSTATDYYGYASTARTETSTATLTVSGTVVTTVTTTTVMDVVETPSPSVHVMPYVGIPDDVETCIAMVYKGDLPDDVADGVANADWWCVAGMYDDSLSADDEDAAVTASAAPPSWTEASSNPFDAYFSSVSAAKANPTSTAEASTSGGVGRDGRGYGVMGMCVVHCLMVVSLVFSGFTVAL